jgi:hypothetical protein
VAISIEYLQDHLFFKYLKTGWTNDLVGLVPSEPKSLDDSACWQTYCRNGLFDALPRSATLHERALALCADDIVFLICQETKLRKTKASITAIVSELEEELKPLLARRATSTQAEAQRLGIQGLLQEKIDSITKTFRQSYEMEMEATPIGLELRLQELLAPWYTVATLKHRKDKGLEIVIYPFGSTSYENRNNIPPYRFWIRLVHLIGVERNVDRIRAQIIAGKQVSDGDMDLAKAFCQFLTTGRSEDMPYIAAGSERVRALTVPDYWETLGCLEKNCQCAFSKAMREKDKVITQRQSLEPTARREREIIKGYFRNLG